MLESIDFHTIKSYSNKHNLNKVKVINVEDDISASFELLKILHTHNLTSGWTLLLAPDLIPSKSFLDSCSIDTGKLLVIRQKHLSNLDYVLNAALNNGNFSAVVAYTDIVEASQLSSIIEKASCNKTALYCFSSNTKQH